MKIQITYELETFHGCWNVHEYVVSSYEEAEHVCKDIESKPDEYHLLDVTRIE